MTEVATVDVDAQLAELAVDAEKCAKASAVYEAIRSRRDKTIVDMRVAGVPVERLQEATGLSHQRISQILNRAGASTRKRRKAQPEKSPLHTMEDEWDAWEKQQEQGPAEVRGPGSQAT